MVSNTDTNLIHYSIATPCKPNDLLMSLYSTDGWMDGWGNQHDQEKLVGCHRYCFCDFSEERIQIDKLLTMLQYTRHKIPIEFVYKYSMREGGIKMLGIEFISTFLLRFIVIMSHVFITSFRHFQKRQQENVYFSREERPLQRQHSWNEHIHVLAHTYTHKKISSLLDFTVSLPDYSPFFNQYLV